MHPERRVRLSKFFTLILRHRPEQVGLTLDAGGRVRASGCDDPQRGEIGEVVRLDARRFELDGGLIRTRYGHSLTLAQPGAAARPPEWLYYALPGQVPTAFARRAHNRGVRFFQVTERLYLAPHVPPDFLHLPALDMVAGAG